MIRAGLKLSLAVAFLASLSLTATAALPGGLARSAFSSSQYPCYQSLLERAGRESRVIVEGSSRALVGIDPVRLAAGLGVSPNLAFNLAHNDRSYPVDAAILREVLRKGTPKLVLVEAYVPSNAVFVLERSAGARRHAGEPVIGGRPLDRLAIGWGVGDGELALDRLGLHDRWLAGMHRLDILAGFVLSGRAVRARIEGVRRFQGPRDTICLPGRRARTPGADAQFARQYLAAHPGLGNLPWTQWPDDRPELLEDPAQRIDRDDLRAIARLASLHRVPLLFFYLPSRHVPPPGTSFAARFERAIGAPLAIPDRATLAAIQRDGYSDGVHLAPKGRAALTDWLASEVRTRIAAR